MLWAILTTEAVRTAQGKFGKGQPMTGEQVRWGLENLKIDDTRLKELGVAGFMQPLKVSCMDHEGDGQVEFQQWDGREWKVITDWIASDQSIVRPMIEASAAQYAQEKGITGATAARKDKRTWTCCSAGETCAAAPRVQYKLKNLDVLRRRQGLRRNTGDRRQPGAGRACLRVAYFLSGPQSWSSRA